MLLKLIQNEIQLYFFAVFFSLPTGYFKKRAYVYFMYRLHTLFICYEICLVLPLKNFVMAIQMSFPKLFYKLITYSCLCFQFFECPGGYAVFYSSQKLSVNYIKGALSVIWPLNCQLSTVNYQNQTNIVSKLKRGWDNMPFLNPGFCNAVNLRTKTCVLFFERTWFFGIIHCNMQVVK